MTLPLLVLSLILAFSDVKSFDVLMVIGNKHYAIFLMLTNLVMVMVIYKYIIISYTNMDYKSRQFFKRFLQRKDDVLFANGFL